MADDRSVDFGSFAFMQRCCTAVDGIAAKTASSETVCEVKKTTDECGQTADAFTRNNELTTEAEGEITGDTPSGVCQNTVGAAMTGINPFTDNLANEGTLICTRARYSESAGEYAKFSGTGLMMDSV